MACYSISKCWRKWQHSPFKEPWTGAGIKRTFLWCPHWLWLRACNGDKDVWHGRMRDGAWLPVIWPCLWIQPFSRQLGLDKSLPLVSPIPSECGSLQWQGKLNQTIISIVSLQIHWQQADAIRKDGLLKSSVLLLSVIYCRKRTKMSAADQSYPQISNKLFLVLHSTIPQYSKRLLL